STDGDPVKGVDHFSTRGLEGQMGTSRSMALCSGAVHGADHQFIDPEVAVARAPPGEVQRFCQGFVKRLAFCQVLDDQLDVINEPAAVKFEGFHEALRIEGRDSRIPQSRARPTCGFVSNPTESIQCSTSTAT